MRWWSVIRLKLYPYNHLLVEWFTRSASDTTMSVANVSGFTGSYYNDGEILALKKVSSTRI